MCQEKLNYIVENPKLNLEVVSEKTIPFETTKNSVPVNYSQGEFHKYTFLLAYLIRKKDNPNSLITPEHWKKYFKKEVNNCEN